MINVGITSIEDIEQIAIDKFNAIKLDGDLYIVPANVAKSNIIDLRFKNNNIYNKELKEKIETLEVNYGDCLTICCNEELDENKKVMELINLETAKFIEFEITSILDHEHREELVNYIASLYENKNVLVTFYIPYNIEGLEELIS